MKKTLIVLSISLFTLAFNVKAQDHRHAVVNPTNPEITEYWDPEVKVITPGTIPSDAIILFDGKDLSNWESAKDGSPALWKVDPAEKSLTVVGKTGKKKKNNKC
jgi:hypothetical protein